MNPMTGRLRGLAGARAMGGALLAASAALLGGCANIGPVVPQEFEVVTTPPGAQASSTDGWECETPCKVEVATRKDFVVTLRKDGYFTKTVTVSAVPAAAEPATMRDRVQVGPPGWLGTAANAVRGSRYELLPNPLKVKLDAEL